MNQKCNFLQRYGRIVHEFPMWRKRRININKMELQIKSSSKMSYLQTFHIIILHIIQRSFTYRKNFSFSVSVFLKVVLTLSYQIVDQRLVTHCVICLICLMLVITIQKCQCKRECRSKNFKDALFNFHSCLVRTFISYDEILGC